MKSRRNLALALLLAAILLAVAILAAWPGADDEPAASPTATVTARARATVTLEPIHTHAPIAAADPLPSNADGPVLGDVLRWAGSTRTAFGCILEEAGHRDPRWNCSAGDSIPKNPCTDEFLYAGPDLPAELTAQVSPLAERVVLHWDAGRLQAWEIAIKPGVSESDVRSSFRLPAAAPSGIDSLEVGPCPLAPMCVSIRVTDRIHCEGQQPD